MCRFAVISCLFAALLFAPCFADKVTVDPNVGRADSVRPTDATSQPALYDPAKDPDKRMAAKVSYEAIGIRLSDIVAAISKQTGVPILCGTSKNDWRTRDIPVAIYVKDVPLGTLLRGIACTTHCILVAEKGDRGIFYCIRQDAKLAKAFDEYPQALQKYNRSDLDWAWDAAARVKDIPEADLRKFEAGSFGAYQTGLERGVSRVLAALGPEYKKRLLANGGFEVTPRDLPKEAADLLKDVFRGVYRYESDRQAKYNPALASSTQPVTDEQLDSGSFTIRGPESGEAYRFCASIQVGRQSDDGIGLVGMATRDRDKMKKLGVPSEPEQPAVPKETEESPDFTRTGGNCPLPAAKVNLEDLKQKSELAQSEVLIEAARQAGISIVMEDWDYHKTSISPMRNGPGKLLRREVPVGEVMRSCFLLDWHGNARDGLYLGRSGWYFGGRTLIPAAVYNEVCKQANSKGLDLEDVLPLSLLSEDQISEWISQSKDLRITTGYYGSPGGAKPLMQSCASLTPDDMALAETTGLPLAKLDPAKVTELLDRLSRANGGARLTGGMSVDSGIRDAEVRPRLVLRIEKQAKKYMWHSGLSDQWEFLAENKYSAIPPILTDKYAVTFVIEADGPNGKHTYASVPGPILPVFTEKRERELVEEYNKPGSANSAPLH